MMQTAQEKFFDFVKQSVLPGKEKAAEEVLAKSFADIDTANYDDQKATQLKQELLPLIEPERQPEITLMLEQFKDTL